MKNLCFLLSVLFLIAKSAEAQPVDSSKLSAGPISLQAQDVEFLFNYIANDEVLSVMDDALKAKFRVANPPSGNTIVTIDGISAGALLYLSSYIRHFPDYLPAAAFSRIDSAIHSCQNSFLQARLNSLTAYESKQFDEKRKAGRKKLTGSTD